LQAIIEATPSDHLTFLVDFSEQFRAWCDAAGLPKTCVFHGLRKLGCTRLAESGCTVHEIAAWSGHLSLREVERYTRAADRRQLARTALARSMNKAV
jgi:integrase